MAVTYHDMTSTPSGALGYSDFYSTQTITSNTDVRDVSQVLDLWVHRETPFLNLLSWGPESGGLTIEWVSEHLGWGYMELSATLATGTSGSAITNVFYDPARSATATGARFGIEEGCMLYGYSTADGEHAIIIVDSVAADGTVTFEFLTTTLVASLAASAKMYIIGNFANEGSVPRSDTSRTRTLLSNTFTILRKDINLTGSQMATNMHAVPSELRHQTRLRLLEMQREREMTLLYSAQNESRSTTVASLMNGVFGFLRGQSGTHIDTSTTSLTPSTLNNVVAECWENDGMPNVFVGHVSQIRKFTDWDIDRIRTSVETKLGGAHITHYLTDVGIELRLVPLRKVTPNLAFVLDTSKIKPRAKKGRKGFIEKLGKQGDYTMWQLISEFSMEFRGYDKGQHGLFTALQ